MSPPQREHASNEKCVTSLKGLKRISHFAKGLPYIFPFVLFFLGTSVTLLFNLNTAIPKITAEKVGDGISPRLTEILIVSLKGNEANVPIKNCAAQSQ